MRSRTFNIVKRIGDSDDYELLRTHKIIEQNKPFEESLLDNLDYEKQIETVIFGSSIFDAIEEYRKNCKGC